MRKSRLTNAQNKYVAELHEWLTNPKNDNLADEIITAKIKIAFDNFLQELLQDEDDCAEFVSAGNITHELDFLPIIFEHFKNIKIYKAIEKNCEIAFSNKYSTESDELKEQRKKMLDYMKKQLS